MPTEARPEIGDEQGAPGYRGPYLLCLRCRSAGGLPLRPKSSTENQSAPTGTKQEHGPEVGYQPSAQQAGGYQ
jgi:hypothetical protein